MTIQQQIVRIAEAQVGVREVGGDNRGPMVVQYQKATWLKPSAWPWCAAFTCWVLREALQITLPNGVTKPDTWRCRDASAYGWEKWGREKKLILLPETARALAGDFVTYDFSHIGIVVKDQAKGGEGFLSTVEGNTDDKGSREGGGVYRKQRHWKLIRTLIRIP